ncbi:hypothetical protein IGJ02_000098 [Enterococcus sp. DIV0724b]|uniref:nitroreductase family protein n=1 Tax=Enterococcus sp. DIV0724b TaxID=2774694 RepID=UPI003D2FE715
MIEEIMSARKSVREFEQDYIISDEILEELLEKSASAPSGHNLQSWRVAVIRDPKKREAIKKVGHEQPQITSSSALLVIFADTNSKANMEKIYSQDVASGFLPKEMLADKLTSSIEYYASQSQEYLTQTAIIDSSLFAMQLMLLAKDRGYDSVPMRGFSQAEIGQIINQPTNYLPIMLISIGKASQPAFDTSRLPVEAFTEFHY